MKNLSFTLILFLCGANFSQAQDSLHPKREFFNRKHFLSASFNMWSPVISNNGDVQMNVYKDGKIVPGDDKFDFGLRIGYMRKVSPVVGVGLEFGCDFFSVHNPTWGYLAAGYFHEFTYEKTDVISGVFMPKVQFSHQGRFFPAGLQHQLGIGFRISGYQPGTFHYMLSYSDDPAEASQVGVPVETEFSKQGYMYKADKWWNKGLTAMYSITMRTPVTKFLAIHYGLRANFNYMPHVKENGQYPYIPEYQTKYKLFAYYLNDRLVNSYLQANIGVTFAL